MSVEKNKFKFVSFPSALLMSALADAVNKTGLDHFVSLGIDVPPVRLASHTYVFIIDP